LILRNPLISAANADLTKGTSIKIEGNGAGPVNVIPIPNAYIAFKKLDMTGIKQLEFVAQANTRDGNTGGTIEVRLNSPEGELIGRTEVYLPGQRPAGTGAQAAQDAGAASAPRSRGPASLKCDIKEVNGIKDIYLVFKNTQAKAVQPLMSLTSVRFNEEKKLN
jgi:cytochrome c